MKIEKISDNQIRCTLTRDDLASRKIDLRELAYGSDKAKLLFQDMMNEAFREYGFSAENSPLMIEAIPLSGESIVLIITRVDNPEELDSRFARFSREDGGNDSSETLSSLDDIIDLISRISSGNRPSSQSARKLTDQDISPLSGSGQPGDPSSDMKSGGTASGADTSGAKKSVSKKAGAKKSGAGSEENAGTAFNLTRFFLFQDIATVIRAAKLIYASYDYQGWNSLYKNPEDGNYFLILRMDSTSPEKFNCVCNILTEFGIAVDYTGGMEEFFSEHIITISSGTALQTLYKL